MSAKFEETLASYIADDVAGLTLNTNCFAGPVSPDPVEGCWVIPSGGPGATRFLGETETEKHSEYQIRMRTDKEDFPAGRTLSLAISDVLHLATHDTDFAAYREIEVIESQPHYLGQDDRGAHEWSQNVRAHIKE
jgi:hypothetical protein